MLPGKKQIVWVNLDKQLGLPPALLTPDWRKLGVWAPWPELRQKDLSQRTVNYSGFMRRWRKLPQVWWFWFGPPVCLRHAGVPVPSYSETTLREIPIYGEVLRSKWEGFS